MAQYLLIETFNNHPRNTISIHQAIVENNDCARIPSENVYLVFENKDGEQYLQPVEDTATVGPMTNPETGEELTFVETVYKV